MRQARSIRERKGLTLEQVAARTSIRFSPLSRFERGVAWLGEAKMRELATLYDCKIDDLIAVVPDEEATAAAKG